MNNSIENLTIKVNEIQALKELKKRILQKFPGAELILYGSKARGEDDEESDIDLLILVDIPVTCSLEEKITRIAYDIELKYDVVFGKIVENKEFWNTSLAKAMPLRWNVDKDGISV